MIFKQKHKLHCMLYFKSHEEEEKKYKELFRGNNTAS
jgi:hypothetical protein